MKKWRKIFILSIILILISFSSIAFISNKHNLPNDFRLEYEDWSVIYINLENNSRVELPLISAFFYYLCTLIYIISFIFLIISFVKYLYPSIRRKQNNLFNSSSKNY